MKRRDFLVSAGLAGAMLPQLARGQVRPCPPPSVSAVGGTSVTTACVGGGSAEADWIVRSTGPGVVWAHDFRDPAEVSNFRWQGGIGNDPNNTGDKSCRHITTDGVTGGACLEINVPTGGVANGGWWRPYSALPGDRGYVSGPAWNPNDRGFTNNWHRGYYGHSDYHGLGQFDGTDFYIQFRCKISASRANAANPESGKLGFIGFTHSTPTQEIVIESTRNRVFDMYSNFGQVNGMLYGPQGDRNLYNPVVPVTRTQPGGSHGSTCTWETWGCGNCWCYPPDEWFTVLMHIVPGHGVYDNQNPYVNLYTSDATNKDSGIQIWVARQGDTSYTKIWDKLDYIFAFDSLRPEKGWNSFLASAYMNGVPAAQGWFHRYDQIIFSKQLIPCPQV